MDLLIVSRFGKAPALDQSCRHHPPGMYNMGKGEDAQKLEKIQGKSPNMVKLENLWEYQGNY
jgi:hypothetical protein